jgi:hypothetical protein
MRKTKRLKIDNEEITVRELTVRQIYGLIDGGEEAAEASFAARFDEFLSLATDLKKEKAMDMAPSELNEVWEAFREVNAAFFSIMAKLGLAEILQKEMGKIFSEEFALSSAPAMAGPSGAMAGSSSSSP